jgi:hypothetical protein
MSLTGNLSYLHLCGIQDSQAEFEHSVSTPNYSQPHTSDCCPRQQRNRNANRINTDDYLLAIGFGSDIIAKYAV